MYTMLNEVYSHTCIVLYYIHMAVTTTEAQHEENMSRNPRSSTTQQGKKTNKRQQIKDKEVLSTLTRLCWPFTDFQQKNIAPCWPRRHTALIMRWVQVVLLPRCPRCSLLLQHGAECRGHHGGGHGRSEGSQRVLGVFTRDVNALEVFLTCEDGRRRWTGEWPQDVFILFKCNVHGSLLRTLESQVCIQIKSEKSLHWFFVEVICLQIALECILKPQLDYMLCRSKRSRVMKCTWTHHEHREEAAS